LLLLFLFLFALFLSEGLRGVCFVFFCLFGGRRRGENRATTKKSDKEEKDMKKKGKKKKGKRSVDVKNVSGMHRYGFTDRAWARKGRDGSFYYYY